MASEKFANLAETTLASGYTSGTTTLSVVSASGFPTVGVFRVRLGNTGKTVWRVDSVSGTTFTGAAEANDANANSGDAVKIVASKAVAERFLQSPDPGGIDAIAGVSAADSYGPVWKLGRPDLVSWAWQNQGGAAVVDANGISFLSIPSQTTNFRSRLISTPATPWTATILMQAHFTVTAANQQQAGIILRESGTGKIYPFYLDAAGQLQAIKFTNDTTFSAVGAVNSTTAFLNSVGRRYWLRITDNGTNLLFLTSRDGVNFTQQGSEGRTVFMAAGPNQFGIFGNVDSSAAAFDASFYSWLQT